MPRQLTAFFSLVGFTSAQLESVLCASDMLHQSDRAFALFQCSVNYYSLVDRELMSGHGALAVSVA